jgi:acetone carboxylase, alpha subunit
MPYQEFVKQWETATPPTDVPFYGSWKDRETIYLGSPDQSCASDAIQLVMMPDPKDDRIAALEKEIAALKGEA